MLPKQYRFSQRLGSEFFRKARKYTSPHLTLFARTRVTKAEEGPKGVVVVPAKVVPSAAKRSRYRRQLKDALLSELKTTNAQVALVLRRVTRNGRTLRAELQELFEQLRVSA